MSANESKVTEKNLPGEGRDCGNGDRFKDTRLCKNQGKQPQEVENSGMYGVESKVFDRKNSNGRNKEMKRNDVCKKPKFTGDCEDMKNCVFIGTKYVTGSEIAKMAKLKVMPGFNEIYTKKYGFTVAQSGLSTGSASDFRNHRIEICSFISDAYGRNYAILQIPLFITIVKKEQYLVILQEQQDEAVRKRGVSDDNDSYLAINADRNKNILFFHIFTMENAFMTLGLRGMVKILQSVNTGSKYFILITNNCAAILQSINIHHAAAMILVDILKVQDDEECDSLRSVVMACDELLQDAESLICLQTVAAGWRLALQAQTNVLNQSAISIDDNESSQQQMMQTAKTSLSSNLLAQKGVHFAIFSVDAVIRLNESGNRRQILIFKWTGRSIKDFYSLEKQVGVGQTRRLQECAILLANKSDKIGPRVKVGVTNKVAEKGLAVKEKMRRNCKRIFAHVCNVLINHQLIHSFPEAIFAKHSVMASEHAYSYGLEQLAGLNGGIRMFNHPEIVTVGVYDVIEDIMSDEDKVIFVGRFEAGNAYKIGLHGSPSQFLDETEQSLHDALSILMTIRCNIYTYLMDFKFKSLRSVILETENKARRSTTLTMPEEEKIINLIAGKAASPKHDNEANAEDESFERFIRKSSPTKSTMPTNLIKKIDCLRDDLLAANMKGHVQCAYEIDNSRMFTSLCKGVCSLINFRINSRHDNIQIILSVSYDQQKCLSNIIEYGRHTISKECPVLSPVKGTGEIDAADRSRRLVCVAKNFLSDLEMRVRRNIIRIVSNTLRPLEESNVAHRKGIEELPSKLHMRQGIQDWEQATLHQSIKLKVETNLMQSGKEILAETKELFRKYREGLKKLAGLKKCLKQDEPISECMLLRAETKSLEEYKVQAIDTKVKSAECQERLKLLQILSGNLNSTRDALRRKVTSGDEAATYLSINEDMSKLNEAVIEELVRSNDNERKRFYQLLDITVMATNVMDQDLQLVRQNCWGISVNRYQKSNLCVSYYERSTKATSVIDHIIKACNAAHTMQYWNIFKKWNERLFYKIYISYKMGRSEEDLSIWRYKGHVLLSDKYIIPGSETSNEYDAGIDYLSYINWRELELKEGRDIEEMIRCELTSRENDNE